MKFLLDGYQLAIFEVLLKWTLLLALGWSAHGLLRSGDARWRLILWRGVLCLGLALPVIQFLPLPEIQIQVPGFEISPPSLNVTGTDQTAAPVENELSVEPVIVAADKNLASSVPVTRLTPRLSRTISWPSLLFMIWTMGAICGAIRLFRGMSQLSTLRRNSSPASPDVQRLAEEIFQCLQVKRSAEVLISNVAVSPFVFGLIQPAIMLPKKLAQSLSYEETAALLRHEIAHLRRNDLFWSLGWHWIKTIFWFHPLLWKIPEAHGLACEEEADRLASSHMEDRASYARLLAQLALRVLTVPEIETQLTANGTAQITLRLRRLGTESGTWKQGHSVAAFGLVLAIALIAAGCKVNREKDSKELEQSKAKVAVLEKRISELEKAMLAIKPQLEVPQKQPEDQQAMTAQRSNWREQFSLWEAYYKGGRGVAKNPIEADKLLNRLVKDIFVVRFEPANGFTPKMPMDVLNIINNSDNECRSGDNRIGVASFFRTKKAGHKLSASFLTEEPDKLRAIIEKNPSLKFLSAERVTAQSFVAYVQSIQESL